MGSSQLEHTLRMRIRFAYARITVVLHLGQGYTSSLNTACAAAFIISVAFDAHSCPTHDEQIPLGVWPYYIWFLESSASYSLIRLRG